MSKIAFLGLGAMGSRMAGHLIEAGHDVTVWNRSAPACEALAAKGAKVAPTPRDAVRGADAAFSMVRDDDASRAVWDDPGTGAAAGLSANAVAVECSTLTVARMRALADAVAAAGAGFVDAPVSGSRPQADAGSLIFLAGGEPALIDRLRPLFDLMGSAVHHCGDRPGDGTMVKLMVNALMGVQAVAVAELLGVGKRHGLDPARAREIIAATPVMSAHAAGMAGLMVEGKDAPLFPIDLIEKDLGNLDAGAEGLGAAVPMSDAARALFGEAIAARLGEANLTAIRHLFGTGPGSDLTRD